MDEKQNVWNHNHNNFYTSFDLGNNILKFLQRVHKQQEIRWKLHMQRCSYIMLGLDMLPTRLLLVISWVWRRHCKVVTLIVLVSIFRKVKCKLWNDLSRLLKLNAELFLTPLCQNMLNSFEDRFISQLFTIAQSWK